MSLLTRDFDYELPESLIAKWPLPNREDSRMMVLHRSEQRIEHRSFRDFPDYLQEGDLAVLNDTKVVPARVFSDDGKIEMLLLEQTQRGLWRCMVKPGRKMTQGKFVTVGGLTGEVVDVLENGERMVHFAGELDLEVVGRLPLPPYVDRELTPEDATRYQTVYADAPGAVAAPTAGLHFTREILERVPHVFVTLHVGVGTFKPVQADFLKDHAMHSEQFVIGQEAAAGINAARRVIAVGTTTVRVLESCMRRAESVQAQQGATDIFIHPPYQFRAVDALLTNFHLPKSTLLMLVSAFARTEFVIEAYREAVRQEYRFFSYGDCMLIL